MTIEEFAGLCGAKKIKKGWFEGKCLAHQSSHRSLRIRTGNKLPFVFKCLSHNCAAEDILRAMGLGWKDVLAPRVVTPEIRERLRDQEYLKILETRWGAYTLLSVIGWEHHDFWVYQQSKTDFEIVSLKAKLASR